MNGRLRTLRTVALLAPWIVAGALPLVRAVTDAGVPYGSGLPDGPRRLLTGFLLGSGVAAVLVRVLVRSTGGERVALWVTTCAYVAAAWVGVMGAAVWARGAAAGWFVICYLWVLAIVFALFPLDRR
jgi:hypothetical protein